MPATIRPVLPSSLINADAADGGAVHAEVTSPTWGDSERRDTMSVATVRAAATPPSARTLINRSMSPWPNRSTRIWEARADSEVGSAKPPADS